MEQDPVVALALFLQRQGGLPWLEEQMMEAYRDSDNRFPVQAAFWAWTGWSQDLVLERPAN